MTKLFYFKTALSFALFSFLILTAGCVKNHPIIDDDDDPVIDEDAIVFDNDVFSTQLGLDYTASWDVVSNSGSEWIKTTINEQGVFLMAEPNGTNELRTAEVSIRNSEGVETTYKIAQKATNSDLRIVSDNSTAWLNYHQTRYEFFVYSATDWALSCDAPWVTTDVAAGGKGSTKVVLSLDANSDSKDKRQATIVITSGNKIAEQTIVQRGRKDFDDVTHYFYVHRATLPVLYTGLDIFTHDKPSFLIDERNTLQEDYLPPHVTKHEYRYFPQNVIDEVREIEKNNPDAIYSYSSDDLRIIYALPIFTRLGIDSSRVKLNLLPDGLGTYSGFFNIPFGEAGTGGDKYREVENRIEQTYADYMANPSLAVAATSQSNNDPYDFDAPHIISQYGSARYVIENKNYLISDDAYVQGKIATNHYVVKPARELLAELPTTFQDEFYKLVNFDMEKNSGLMDAREKPFNLIIIGTHTSETAPDFVRPEQQAAYVKKVIDQFGSDHNIFYKAHPSDQAYLTYEDDFPGLKLITPARMPFDVFTWALNGKIDALGGFSSTVFVTVPTDKVKFMFAPNLASLGSPVYESIFGGTAGANIKWMDLP